MIDTSNPSNSAGPHNDAAGSSAVLERPAPPASRSWKAVAAISALIVLIIAVVALSLNDGDPRHSANSIATPQESGAAGNSDTGDAAMLSKHPLEPALELAEHVLKNIQKNVHDYTATVIKQERIAGQLGPEEVTFVKIRSRPFSVYMKFLEPPNLRGQEVIYVDGANDGKIVAHAGSGVQALVGTVRIPPQGPLAMLGQRYPITELGIENLTRRLIEVGRHDEHYGETYVWRNDDAKVGDRPCLSFTVMHPVKRTGFIFHIARIFVDKELMVPLHYEAYDWPEKPGDPPQLLERYTYARLTLNPGLTDADFDPNNPEYNFVSK